MRSRILIFSTALVMMAACNGNGPTGGAEFATLVVVVTSGGDGVLVPGAEVELDPGDRMASTDARGEARFPNLPAGDYVVTVRIGVSRTPFTRSVSLQAPLPPEVRVTVPLTPAVLEIRGPSGVVEWGAPGELQLVSIVGGGADPARIEWVSTRDFYLGELVVLGRGPVVSTAPLRPGRTTVEARLRDSGGTIIGRASVDVQVSYRESWNMDLLGMVPYPDGSVADVWVEGRRAYLARRSAGGVSIVDLDGIVEVGRYTQPGLLTQDLIANGSIVYFTHEGQVGDGYPFGVTILDVSQPSMPVVLGGAPRNEVPSVHTVWLEGTTLSAAVPSSVSRQFHLYDVSNPAAPRPLSTIPALNARAHDSHSRDGVFFGAYLPLAPGETGELLVASIADPARPVLLARLAWTGGFQHSAWLSADGRYLYEADEIANAPIRIFDVTNPANAVLAATYQPRLGTVPHHFQVRDGRFAYLAHYKNGVEVIDVSDPLRPRLVGFYDTHPGEASDGAVSGASLVPAHDEGQSLYEGVWGVHWTDDGRIVASDMNRGLFVFRFRG